jgi:hypothetical protein
VHCWPVCMAVHVIAVAAVQYNAVHCVICAYCMKGQSQHGLALWLRVAGVERLLGRLSAAMHGCAAAAFESKCRCQESALLLAP